MTTRTNGESFSEVAWMSLLRTLDSGTMGGDTGSPFFLFMMLLVTFGGVFVVSALIGVIMAPGATRTLKWIPKATGVYPFYCTDFCSALHQEMQGYVRVSPAGSNVPLTANVSKKAQAQIAAAAANRNKDSHEQHMAAGKGR